MPDLANHVHGDHLESLLKVSADQWNTLVNFASALYGLAGQFYIGTNRLGESVMSRAFERQLHIRAAILNRFAELGRPQTAAVA